MFLISSKQYTSKKLYYIRYIFNINCQRINRKYDIHVNMYTANSNGVKIVCTSWILFVCIGSVVYMMNSHPCDWGSSPGNHTLMRYALNNINIKFISDESSADFGIIFM